MAALLASPSPSRPCSGPHPHPCPPQVYRILMRTTSAVQPLSCDEAYLDVTGLGDPGGIAARLRAEIFEATGCAASTGIGPNPLIARLVGFPGRASQAPELPPGVLREHAGGWPPPVAA
jgi:nucleotidyltransferase/DNA polymerase involved in DNA repair